jgi:phosphoglucan,water dikinase
MHTTDVLKKDPAWATVELCAGLGETLAGGRIPGAPYRMRCGRLSGGVLLEACASFSEAYRPAPGEGVRRERLDYSQAGLSTDPAAITQIGLRLAKLAEFLESQFGSPQDVEGLVRGGLFCVVQSRPQQGV